MAYTEELWWKMTDCSEAESWAGMSLQELEQLEAEGKEVGEDNLWIRCTVDGEEDVIPIGVEIERRKAKL